MMKYWNMILTVCLHFKILFFQVEILCKLALEYFLICSFLLKFAMSGFRGRSKVDDGVLGCQSIARVGLITSLGWDYACSLMYLTSLYLQVNSLCCHIYNSKLLLIVVDEGIPGIWFYEAYIRWSPVSADRDTSCCLLLLNNMAVYIHSVGIILLEILIY